MKLTFLTFLATGFCAVGPANAAVTVYSDLTSFNSALPGGTSTLEDFNSAPTGPFAPGSTNTFDGFEISYTDAVGSGQNVGIYTPADVNAGRGTAIGATNQLAWGEDDDLGIDGFGDGPTITFSFFADITAFAFDYSDSDSTDSYSVTIGGEPEFPITGPGSTFQTFVGFISDTAFSEIVFRQTATGGFTEAFSVDNIRTNGISSAVPLPAGLPLLLAGVGAIGFLGRARKN